MSVSEDAYLKSATDIFIAAHLPALLASGLTGDELTAACVRGIGRAHTDLVRGLSAARNERSKEMNPDGKPAISGLKY